MPLKCYKTFISTGLLLLFLLISIKCGYTKEMPVKNANVLFLIDQSNSVWHLDFLREIRFVQEVVQRFEIGLRYTRVAVATYAENIHVRIRFKDYKNIAALTKKIGLIKRPNAPDTNLASGLKGFDYIFSNNSDRCTKKHTQKVFALNYNKNLVGRKERKFYLNRVRRSRVIQSKRALKAKKEKPLNVIVVIGDGHYRDEMKVKKMVHCLRIHKVHIFAVGVGRNMNTKKLDSLVTYPPILYRINITHRDPKVLLQDTISDSKPGKIWELMIKNRAMTEDCLPYRSRVQLNFVFDILSKNSWRYPVLVDIAEDMFVRMIKKYRSSNRKGDFVRLKFYPGSYGSNRTIDALDHSTWEEDDVKRYEDLLKKSIEVKSAKKEMESENKMQLAGTKDSTKRNAWLRLNNAIEKVIKHTKKQDIPSIQQVIIYVTDRPTDPFNHKGVLAVTDMLVYENKKMASKRKFELFGVALGGFFNVAQVQGVLRRYQANPQSRLYAFESLHGGYDKIMSNFADLFCDPIENRSFKPNNDP